MLSVAAAAAARHGRTSPAAGTTGPAQPGPAPGRHGFRIAARATSCYVTGSAPHELVTGELDRARQWGERLAAGLPHESRA